MYIRPPIRTRETGVSQTHTKPEPGSFLYSIIRPEKLEPTKKQPFYVYNRDDYLKDLEKCYTSKGLEFKKPEVYEIPKKEIKPECEKVDISKMDRVIVKTTVLKNGKVRVKLITSMVSLYEKYYSKYKQPPIKTLCAALKSMGHTNEFVERVGKLHENRKISAAKNWKNLEKIFDKPSASSKKKTKKKEVEPEPEPEPEPEQEEEEEEEENEDDDAAPDEEAIEVDQEDDEEVVEEEYFSDVE
jgi:hypothetical protein